MAMNGGAADFGELLEDDDEREDIDEKPSAAPASSEDMFLRGFALDLPEDEMRSVGTYLSDTIELHLEERQPREQQWEIERRAYLARPQHDGQRKNWPLEDASNITVPYIQTRTNQIVARIMQALFATQPHWIVEQVNRQWADFAKPLERYLDFVQRHMWKQRKVIKNFVQEMCKIGTSVLTVEWRDETIFRFDMVTRQTVRAGQRRGPNVRWVSRVDFLIPEGYDDPQVAPWVAERQSFSAIELRSLQYQRILQNVDDVLKAPDDEPEVHLSNRQFENQSESDMAVDTGDPDNPTGNDATLYFLWKVWFRRDLDGDGYPEDYVAMVHPPSRTVLRIAPNPYVTSMRPYIVSRFVEVEGEFDGLGTSYVLRDTQAELSTIHNQRRDNATLSNTRMWVSTITSNISDTIRPRHGKVLKVMNPQTDLKELRMADLRQVDAFEENITRQAGDEAIGMNDVSNANVTSPVGRAAATTIMAIMEEGSRRFDMNTSELREALGEEANMVCEMFQTHGLPEPQDHLSPEQFFGEESAEDAQRVRALFQIQENIRGLLHIRLNASTAAINKEIEKQSAMQLYQTQLGHMQQVVGVAQLVANPQVPPPVRAFLVKAFQGLDQNLERVFQSFGRFDLESTLVGPLLAQVFQETMMQPPQPQLPGMGEPEPQGPPPQGPPPGGGPQGPPPGAGGAQPV